MRKHSRGKQWTVEVEMWGAARAREAERRGRLRMTRVEVQPEEVRPWDLVRSQAQMWALALLLTEAGTRLWKRGPEQMWLMEAFWEILVEMKVETVKAWAREQARQLAWAWVWAAEKEAQESMPARALEGLGLDRAQVQVWLRMWTLGEAWEQKQKSRTRRVLSTPWVIHLSPDIWPRRQQGYWWLIQVIAPIARLPPELLHQIFLIIIDNDNDSPLVLMRVCKDWYNIVTGIWGSLKLGITTPKDAVIAKLERDQWILDVLVDTEIDRPHFAPSQGAYQAIFAAMQATSRWRSLVVETFPTQADLPEDLVNRGLQQCSDPVLNSLRTLIIKCPCEKSPLLDRLLRILGNTASRELTTVTIHSQIVISFLVPTYSSIFRSVIVLSLDARGLSNPADLLPHLHQLEILTASHLPLPVYHNDVGLPFVHTLRHLTLRSVSIQWMSGRTFHALESCTILFPLHRHILHTFRTTLPNCKHLSFEGYPLDILSGVSAPKLANLSVKCSTSHKPRGNRQLALFSSQALQEGGLAPRVLHISIEAMNSAWTKAFASMSNLEELVIDNARPSSLRVKALRSLVVHPSTNSTPGAYNAPILPSLKRIGLRYRRWLRPSEHFDLIPVFMSIIRSRQQSRHSLQSFFIWGSSDQEVPLELIDGSQIEIELTTYQNRPVIPTVISGLPFVRQQRQVSVWLTLDISSLPTHNARRWSAVRIPYTPSVHSHREGPMSSNILFIDVVVLGATKRKEYTEACRSCKERRGAGPMIDFQGETDIIRVKEGIARVHFVFCCDPAHRDEEKYCSLEVVLSGWLPDRQLRTIVRKQLPYYFDIYSGHTAEKISDLE